MSFITEITLIAFTFVILSCSAFNSTFVTTAAIFLSKSELCINPEKSDLSTNTFSLNSASSSLPVNLS